MRYKGFLQLLMIVNIAGLVGKPLLLIGMGTWAWDDFEKWPLIERVVGVAMCGVWVGFQRLWPTIPQTALWDAQNHANALRRELLGGRSKPPKGTGNPKKKKRDRR